MGIKDILMLLGGLGMFLFGMRIMGQGLEHIAGGKFDKLLSRMTDRPVKGMLLGLLVTAVIQSSSATTVMVVGFVNSGVMQLSNAVGVIMGANIGTTVTSWILSLAGIESSNVVVSLFKPESLAAILAIVGILMLMAGKKSRTRDFGSIFLGFTVLMVGMAQMSGAVKPLAEVPAFVNILTLFRNPVLGVLAGAVLTAVIQSSSASVGILQALTMTGRISVGVTIPIIMGQNIGTCVTALISCAGASKNAKRAAMVHLYFNLLGTILFLVLYYILLAVFDFGFVSVMATPLSIAVAHSVFNVFTTAALLPCARLLERLATLTIRDKKEEAIEAPPLLDERLLVTPGVAVDQCRRVTCDMARTAREAIYDALECLRHYDPDAEIRIKKRENVIDEYEDVLGTYMVKLSARSLSQQDSHQVGMLLHMIGDLERLGDHAMNLMETAHEMAEKNITFSREAKKEMDTLCAAMRQIVDTTVRALTEDDVSATRDIEPLEQVIDNLKDEMRSRHIARLQEGACTIEMGFVFSDLLTDIERVGDHCSNIGVALLEAHDPKALPAHHYLNDLKISPDAAYTEAFQAYTQQYEI